MSRITTPPAARRICQTAGAVATAYAVAYPTVLRGRCLTWGATPEEAARTMPGDDLLAGPDIVSTRAITVEAPPDAIWPWLAQMGSGRGGAYTYDWIENLFGLGMHSVDEVLPEFQAIAIGDSIPLKPGGPELRVEVVEPGRALAVRHADGNWIWSFGLYPTPDGAATRLVSRNRIATWDLTLPARVMYRYLMEPSSLVMERKMLLGIRSRAEQLASGERDAPDGTVLEAAVDYARCARAWFGMARGGRLSRPRQNLGAVLRFADGTTSRVFRETRTVGVPTEDPVVLVIGFRLAPLDDVGLMHGAFLRECLIHTPLFAGYPGFRSKLWLEDPHTRIYRGVYEWDGPSAAEHYARRMVGLLRPFSSHGTARFHIVPGLDRDSYLADPAQAAGDDGDAWWRLAVPLEPARTP